MLQIHVVAREQNLKAGPLDCKSSVLKTWPCHFLKKEVPWPSQNMPFVVFSMKYCALKEN